MNAIVQNVVAVALVLGLGPFVFSLPAGAAPVTVEYVARVATSTGTPFGLSVPLDTEVTGSFTYDTGTPDTNPADDRGDYSHSVGAFTANLSGFATVVTGSLTPFVQIENLAVDTFRFIDGMRTVGNQGGTMAVNSQDDPDVELLIAVSDGSATAVSNDDLPAVFPFDFTQLAHTFSLKDDQGTLLLQIIAVTPVVAKTWGSVKAIYR